MLSQRIIELLADSPGANAAWLHQECNLRYRNCSIQAVYQELNKLQSQGIVVKVKNTFSLSLSWSFSLINFADKIYDNYVASASHLQIIPERSSQISWRFNDLLRLDDLWVQAMIALFGHTRSKQMFSWIPHPWFYFAQIEKVSQFYKLYEQEKWHYYATIGGDTFLDRYYAQNMKVSRFEYRIGQTPVFSDMSKHYCIIGDYIISVKLDKLTSQRIEELFSSIHSLADATYERVSLVLSAKAKLTLKIEHSPTKAKKYAKKFARYFGVSKLD